VLPSNSITGTTTVPGLAMPPEPGANPSDRASGLGSSGIPSPVAYCGLPPAWLKPPRLLLPGEFGAGVWGRGEDGEKFGTFCISWLVRTMVASRRARALRRAWARRRRSRRATRKTRRAAPPMAMPTLAPVLRPGDGGVVRA